MMYNMPYCIQNECIWSTVLELRRNTVKLRKQNELSNCHTYHNQILSTQLHYGSAMRHEVRVRAKDIKALSMSQIMITNGYRTQSLPAETSNSVISLRVSSFIKNQL